MVKRIPKQNSSNVFQFKPERSNFTKSIHRWDRCLEEDDRAHNDHNPLHTIAHGVGNRWYPLQYHIRNLQAHSQKTITISLRNTTPFHYYKREPCYTRPSKKLATSRIPIYNFAFLSFNFFFNDWSNVKKSPLSLSLPVSSILVQVAYTANISIHCCNYQYYFNNKWSPLQKLRALYKQNAIFKRLDREYKHKIYLTA